MLHSFLHSFIHSPVHTSLSHPIYRCQVYHTAPHSLLVHPLCLSVVRPSVCFLSPHLHTLVYFNPFASSSSGHRYRYSLHCPSVMCRVRYGTLPACTIMHLFPWVLPFLPTAPAVSPTAMHRGTRRCARLSHRNPT